MVKTEVVTWKKAEIRHKKYLIGSKVLRTVNFALSVNSSNAFRLVSAIRTWKRRIKMIYYNVKVAHIFVYRISLSRPFYSVNNDSKSRFSNQSCNWYIRNSFIPFQRSFIFHYKKFCVFLLQKKKKNGIVYYQVHSAAIV